MQEMSEALLVNEIGNLNCYRIELEIQGRRTQTSLEVAMRVVAENHSMQRDSY